MTYKHYILVNNLKDTEDTYRKYLAQYHTHWATMPEGMKDQFISVNFKYRFTNMSWAE